MTIGVKITINRRIKELDKGIRQAKKDWHKYEDLRCKISDEAPRYGNEYDYSTKMNWDDQEKYDKAEHNRNLSTKIQLSLEGERRYLKAILKGKMINFSAYGSGRR